MRTLFAGAMLVLAVSGCTKVFMQSHEKTEAAEKNGDVAYLKKVCAGEVRLRYEGDKGEACDWLAKREALNTPVDCDTVVKVYEQSPKAESAFQLKMGKKFVECGKIKETFETLVPDSFELLNVLEDGGVNMDAAWVKYLQENKGSGFMATKNVVAAMRKINDWLAKKAHLGHCAETLAAATGASEAARVWVMPYYSEAQCKDGAPMVAELLLSDTADHRMWACNALGAIGGKAVLAKVQTLAQSDGFSTLRETQAASGNVYGVKVYPVREACEAAAGKIKLRAM